MTGSKTRFLHVRAPHMTFFLVFSGDWCIKTPPNKELKREFLGMRLDHVRSKLLKAKWNYQEQVQVDDD